MLLMGIKAEDLEGGRAYKVGMHVSPSCQHYCMSQTSQYYKYDADRIVGCSLSE